MTRSGEVPPSSLATGSVRTTGGHRRQLLLRHGADGRRPVVRVAQVLSRRGRRAGEAGRVVALVVARRHRRGGGTARASTASAVTMMREVMDVMARQPAAGQ
jgi:hypothetical protein